MRCYRAYAKLNLTLDIVGLLPNGYHAMDMLMQSISLHDTLCLERAEELSLRVEGGNLPVVPENLVLRAARLLQEQTGCRQGVRARLVKRIPIEAGLGGGSADAAAALVGLNELWGLGLSQEALLELGGRLGADVPFCIRGGTARATGSGTTLQPLSRSLPLHFALCQPCAGLPTKAVFRAYDEAAFRPRKRFTPSALEALANADLHGLGPALGNGLEPAACALEGGVLRGLKTLEDLGALAARMSGSGSAVFGLFEDEDCARAAAARLADAFGNGFYAKAVDCGVEARTEGQARAGECAKEEAE